MINKERDRIFRKEKGRDRNKIEVEMKWKRNF